MPASRDRVRAGPALDAYLPLPFFPGSCNALQPSGHTQSGDKQDHAHNQEQEEQKLRNSRCRRGNTGEAKDRRDQRNYQKYNSPTQHNNSPPSSAYSCVLAILRARSVVAVVGRGAIHNVASSRIKFGPR